MKAQSNWWLEKSSLHGYKETIHVVVVVFFFLGQGGTDGECASALQIIWDKKEIGWGFKTKNLSKKKIFNLILAKVKFIFCLTKDRITFYEEILGVYTVYTEYKIDEK